MFYAHYSSERAHLFLKVRFCEMVAIFRLHTRQRTSENLKVGRSIFLFIYLFFIILVYISLGKVKCG